MECNNCQTHIPEGGVFCPKCGKRADGKILCVKCSNYYEGDFCPFCGNRTDGKKACSNCGQYFDGEFCPYCGKEKTVKSNKSSSKKTSSEFVQVERLLSPSILLVSMLVLFICSFFIGLVGTVGSGNNSADLNATTFYFFGDAYSELKLIKDIINEVPSNQVYYTGMSYLIFTGYLPIIICTVAVALNIIISFICLIYSVIKFGINFNKGENISLVKPMSWSLFSLFIAVFFPLATFYSETLSTSVNMSVSLSAGSIVAIVFGLVGMISVAVLKNILLGKKLFFVQNLSKIIMSIISIALIITVVSLVCTSFVEIISTSSTLVSSLSSFFIAILGANPSNTVLTDTRLAYVIVCTIMLYLIVICGAIMFKKLVCSSCLEKGEKIEAHNFTLVLSILITVFVIVYFVFSLIFIGDLRSLLDDNIAIGRLIVFLIMSILLCIVSVIYKIIMKKFTENIIE